MPRVRARCGVWQRRRLQQQDHWVRHTGSGCVSAARHFNRRRSCAVIPVPGAAAAANVYEVYDSDHTVRASAKARQTITALETWLEVRGHYWHSLGHAVSWAAPGYTCVCACRRWSRRGQLVSLEVRYWSSRSISVDRAVRPGEHAVAREEAYVTSYGAVIARGAKSAVCGCHTARRCRLKVWWPGHSGRRLRLIGVASSGHRGRAVGKACWKCR